MRVYISVDMEGIAGVVHESQTDPTTPAFAAEYGRFRRLMTAEANAAVEGALAAGDRKSTRLNSSHTVISYAVFCLKKKKKKTSAIKDLEMRTLHTSQT